MSESIESARYFNSLPTRQERMRVFIGDEMSESDRETAQILATDFEDVSKPMEKTAVLIPVAAQQDAGHIVHTMGEYAKQRGCDPFTIFLYLNTPDITSPKGKKRTWDSLKAVGQARRLYPNLDIRSALMQDDESTIGGIRRDLWNAAILLADHEGLFSNGPDDVIGINNDIDTTFISPHYIARIQQHYKKRQARANQVNVPSTAHSTVGTRVSHAVLPSHPNVGKVTRWIDNSLFQAPNHVSYEAGFAIPFSQYAKRGGFRRTSLTHETSWAYDDFPRVLHHLTGAQLYTSPRRYIDRVAEHGTEGIWKPGSFGPTNRCREVLLPDISTEQAEDLILNRLQEDLQYYWLPGAMHPIYEEIKHASTFNLGAPSFEAEKKQEAIARVERQIAKAARLLERVIHSSVLADIVRTGIDTTPYAESQVTSVILLNRMTDIHFSKDEITLKIK